MMGVAGMHGRGAYRAGKVILLVVLIVAVLIGVFVLRHSFLMKRNSDYCGNAANLGGALLLEDVPVLSQRHGYSCGLATLAMVRCSLGNSVTEEALTAELGQQKRQRGMLPDEFVGFANQALNGRAVELVRDRPDSEVLALVYGQLKKGMPVPIYFATENQWDLPNYDTHYSLIIGMDPTVGEFTVANAYGFMETVDIGPMLDAMKYRNYRSKPLYFLVAEYCGMIGMNNVFLIDD